jgi:hypothetical protein
LKNHDLHSPQQHEKCLGSRKQSYGLVVRENAALEDMWKASHGQGRIWACMFLGGRLTFRLLRWSLTKSSTVAVAAWGFKNTNAVFIEDMASKTAAAEEKLLRFLLALGSGKFLGRKTETAAGREPTARTQLQGPNAGNRDNTIFDYAELLRGSVRVWGWRTWSSTAPLQVKWVLTRLFFS